MVDLVNLQQDGLHHLGAGRGGSGGQRLDRPQARGEPEPRHTGASVRRGPARRRRAGLTSCRISSKFSLSSRCAMLSLEPVKKLSMQITCSEAGIGGPQQQRECGCTACTALCCSVRRAKAGANMGSRRASGTGSALPMV